MARDRKPTLKLVAFHAMLESILDRRLLQRGPLDVDSSVRRYFCMEVALWLLHDYTHITSREFDVKYPEFQELACKCGTFGDRCTCVEEAISAWGLKDA